MGKSGSCPDVSSECTQAGTLHKLVFNIITLCTINYGKVARVLMFRLNAHNIVFNIISTSIYICTIFPKNN